MWRPANRSMSATSISRPPTIPPLEPAEGYRHVNTVTETTAWSPSTTVATHAAPESPCPTGLLAKYGFDADRLADASDPDGAADRGAACQKRPKERAERRKLIALNKLGEAAAIVRH